MIGKSFYLTIKTKPRLKQTRQFHTRNHMHKLYHLPINNIVGCEVEDDGKIIDWIMYDFPLNSSPKINQNI